MDYTLLLDSPGEPKRTIQIAKIGGDFEHSKYGNFAITEDDVASWKRNLDHLPGHRALIDEDHSADRTPRRTEASGWITDVRLENGTPVADVEWTSKGEQAIRDGRYLFISPTFGPFTDEHGVTHDNTLIGAALTNRPFLNMPSLCLASDERVSEAVTLELADLLDAQLKALDAGAELNASTLALLDALTTKARKNLDAPSDSPAAEMDTATLIKTLDLDDSADEAKILETVASFKEQAAELAKLQKRLAKNPTKTLEQQAADNGLVLLDAAKVTELTQAAAEGAEARKLLHAQAFDHAFDAALNDPRGPRVKPAEKEDLRKVYTLDAELGLKLINEREPIAGRNSVDGPNGAPTFELSDDADPREVMAAGLHPDSHSLDQRIRKFLLDNDLGPAKYAEVAEQYMKGQVRL